MRYARISDNRAVYHVTVHHFLASSLVLSLDRVRHSLTFDLEMTSDELEIINKIFATLSSLVPIGHSPPFDLRMKSYDLDIFRHPNLSLCTKFGPRRSFLSI